MAISYKLSSLGRATFNDIIHKCYSATYWQQAEKLGDYFDLIDWEACGDVSWMIPNPMDTSYQMGNWLAPSCQKYASVEILGN